MYLAQDDIKEVHLEITSRCQLKCSQCARTIDKDNFSTFLNKDIPFELVEKVFTKKFCRQLDFLYINGNYGDISVAKNLFPILDHFCSQGLRAFQLHTNGSFDNNQFWKNLAKYFNERGRVVFSIDGLADTNHLYRKESKWEVVIQSLSEFIKAGGRARWEFLVFEHNKHQIEEARKIAMNLGVKEFKVKYSSRELNNEVLLGGEIKKDKTNSSPQDSDFKSKAFSSFTNIIKTYGSFLKYSQVTEISCITKKKQSIYIDFMGQVWPCCWVGSNVSKSVNAKKDSRFSSVLSKYSQGFNSLAANELTDILQHKWFQNDLESSWKKEGSDSRLLDCTKYCSKSYQSGCSDNNFKLDRLTRV